MLLEGARYGPFPGCRTPSRRYGNYSAEAASPWLLPPLRSQGELELRGTNQETLPSVQGDQRLVHPPAGSLQQQLGVALVGVDQVGERLLVPGEEGQLSAHFRLRGTSAARPERQPAAGPTAKTPPLPKQKGTTPHVR